ncbi:MAG: HipA domain-containing protein [Bacteroidota bacterium]|nr:HipA domain-containing protein [Bacteroidota bacterium]
MLKQDSQKHIYVYADWKELKSPHLLGVLKSSITRGSEIFSFEYDENWLKSGSAQVLDPDLVLFTGPQYLNDDKINFGLFLDSSPDRWGRLLMKRKEAVSAKTENRPKRKLYESDYLLGVFDEHRMGGLRFKLDPDGEFLANNRINASPPWASLRDLEYASLQLENEDIHDENEYLAWLNILLVPGSSLGGARPKSSVVDPNGKLWIAKFPSSDDLYDIGAWEMLVHELALNAGLNVADSRIQKFSSNHHTYLTRRFDRTSEGERIHFSSALTMLGYKDGTNSSDGASYLELVEFLTRQGARLNQDLEELWKRIVFYICVSNTDDHLRNHGFILQNNGWILSPAFDINPIVDGSGLSLNITDDDNSLDLDLAFEVSEYFRVNSLNANIIIRNIRKEVKKWRSIASRLGISKYEQVMMSNAFRNA